jgi:cob(I)alamin adenosyltransferase
MVRLDVITTRGGDAGQTSLGDGTRLAKDALRIEAIGAVDEANAALGLLRLQTAGREEDAMLARIQNDLFDLGADLCMPGVEGEGRLRMTDAQCARLRIAESQVTRLEQEIDELNKDLTPLQSFVLPGGTPAAAHAHLARTTARRAERVAVALGAAEPLNPVVLRYLNRLSDHLFVLSRRLNAGADVLWVPGQGREAPPA